MTQTDSTQTAQPRADFDPAEIRAALARDRISQTHVANTLGLSRATVSRKLSGETPVSVSELVAIAGVIGCDPCDLLPKASA